MRNSLASCTMGKDLMQQMYNNQPIPSPKQSPAILVIELIPKDHMQLVQLW